MEIQITEALEIKIRKKETEKRVRTKVPASHRIIQYAQDRESYTLDEISADLGLKITCIRTHMSYVNSNPAMFAGVLFRRIPKTKTYRLV